MDENYATNILRAILANLHFQTAMTVSRELFGKSYFALGVAEKATVDQVALSHVGGNYNSLTPEFFAQPERQPAGFGTAHPAAPPAQ